MEAQELRIGNYVYDEFIENSDETQRVERKVSGYDIECIEVDGCFYQSGIPVPIPLTEDRLLGYGFKETEEGCGFHSPSFRKGGLFLRHYLMGGFLWGITDDGRDYELGEPIAISYVHQLQNFYFSFAGEELTTQS